MKIQNFAPSQPLKPLRTPQENQPPTPPEKKSTAGMSLPPGNRHHWDDKKAAKVRKFRDLMMPILFRVKDKGFENIPKDGNFIAGSTHQGYMDAPLASRVPDNGRPFGSMSDIKQFSGPLGKMLADFGSFPVDRYGDFQGTFPDPVDHAREILNQDKNFVFYPEGRIWDTGFVQPIKTGVGRIAVGSNVKYALPIAQHYSKDKEKHPFEALVGGAVSAAVAAAGIYAAGGGSLAAGVAGLVTGAIGGGAVGAGLGFLKGPKGEIGIKAMNAVKYGAAAAVLTGVGAAAVGALAPGLAPALIGTTSVLTGLAGLGVTYHWTHRTLAHTSVGQPIEVEPYRQRAAASGDSNAEALRLTGDFHTAMKGLKDELTGKETPFKMDHQGRSWGKQEDGCWALLELKNKREWVPAQPLVYES
ncbi:hypothetical protein ABS71_03295 [bacterium SCN 62-11]|nr:1-acyl-sn-glycerol-3-phosphate acyltransferase [Candidatus Eremiobacteraeota bacterium]ODT76532.1 MAG: hypothetical protein ABS71_03295 [bacterium SCN 62-11]